MSWLAFILFTCPLWLVLLVRPVLWLLALTGWARLLWLPCLPVMVFAWVVDVLTAHTWWPLFFGWPRRGEWTVSDTLERIVGQHQHPRWLLAACIAGEIDAFSPGHIRALGSPSIDRKAPP